TAGPGGGAKFDSCNPHKDAWRWQVQAGISKNWTGWGNSIFYGEYGQHHNFGAEQSGRNFGSTSSTDLHCVHQIASIRMTDAGVSGVGLVQNCNNAATDWYIGYRNYHLDVISDGVCGFGVTAANKPTTPGTTTSGNGTTTLGGATQVTGATTS